MCREQKQPWEACLHWPAVAVEVQICLVCFVSLNTCLALVLTGILLELHFVNNIYCLHLVIEDISLFGGIIAIK